MVDPPLAGGRGRDLTAMSTLLRLFYADNVIKNVATPGAFGVQAVVTV